MKLRKLIAIILCLAMFLPALVACNKADTTNDQVDINSADASNNDKNNSSGNGNSKTEKPTSASNEETTEDPTKCNHEWVGATCTSPKTCSKCKTTEGTMAGHKVEIIPAIASTCTEEGKTEGKKCSVCDITIKMPTKTTTIDHDYINVGDKCSRCDAIMPSVALQYSINADNTTCTITGIGTVTSNELYIPPQIDGYTVTTIGDSAFNNCTNLTRVVIPYTVTNISYDAFASCNYIKSITIPSSVTSIGDYAFGFCSNLEKINVSKNHPTLCLKGLDGF